MRAIAFTSLLVTLIAAGCGDAHQLAPNSATARDWSAGKKEQQPKRQRPDFVVADRLFHAGVDGNLGLSVSAKFRSGALMSAALRLDRRLGSWAGRPWTLADVLVKMDLNANGHVASWTISGPRPLIEDYSAKLRAALAAGEIYSLRATPKLMLPTAYLEADER